MKPSYEQTRRCASGRQAGRGLAACELALAAWLLMVPLCGCNGQPVQTRPQIAPQQYAPTADKDEMAEKIRGFVGFFRATVEQTATELEQKATAREERQAATRFRVRLSDQCRTAASQSDPAEAMLDLWALAYRLVDFLSVGEGRQLFGTSQPVALQAAEEIRAAIDEIARKSLSESVFEKTRQDVVAYVKQNPMQEGFLVRPAESFSDVPQGEQVLQQLVAIPFAPIAALGGVSRTPESVHAVARSMDRFTDTVEDFPANARWQLQLLGTSFGQTPQFTDLMDNLRQFSDSSARMADNTTEFVDVAKKMPHELRTEAENLLDRIDASQPELRTTLGEAKETVAMVSSASNHVRDTVVEARVTLDNVQKASQALEKAAQAVQATAQEILKFVPASMKDETGRIIGDSGQSPENTDAAVEKPASSPVQGNPDDSVETHDARFSFQAVTQSAIELGETSDKLRALLTDFRSFLDAKTFSSEVVAVDTQWRSAADFTSMRIRDIVDHVAKRTAQLLLLFFVLLVLYRLLSRQQNRVKSAARPR